MSDVDTFTFNRVCVYYDNHCGETLREAITKMCQERGYPLDLIIKHVAEAGAARTLFCTKFGKQTAWPFAINSDYQCLLGRQVEVEATKTFEMATEWMSNEDELIGLCKAAVTKKMLEVKEVSLHLPYRQFRRASLILASKKWLAEAQAQPSTPIGMVY